MRVFMTGGTGYIGTAVLKALVEAGHQVSSLARSKASALQIEALGGTALAGHLEDPVSFQSAVAAHDAIVHMAFESGPRGPDVDHQALKALLEAARSGGSPKALVYTSGVLVLGDTGDGPAYENASTNGAFSLVAWRPGHERLTLDAATEALATAVIRPGFVYGGTKGLLSGFFESAAREGAAAYVGDGANRMALVHRDDLARLYRLVVESKGRGVFHGVDGAAPRVVELARAASRAAGRDGAIHSMPLAEARGVMGPFADALCVDQVVASRRWAPAHKPALESVAEAFAEWQGEVKKG